MTGTRDSPAGIRAASSLAQRVLPRDLDATLLTTKEVVAEREGLQPGVWTPKKVEHLIKKVRDRLEHEHVEGMNPLGARRATTTCTGAGPTTC
jgi:hypothetical protein